MSLDATSYLLGKKSGGSGGTTNYSDLSNKPQINNTELSGNKSSSDLGLQDELVSGTNLKTINNQSLLGSGNITIGGGSDAAKIYISTSGIGGSSGELFEACKKVYADYLNGISSAILYLNSYDPDHSSNGLLYYWYDYTFGRHYIGTVINTSETTGNYSEDTNSYSQFNIKTIKTQLTVENGEVTSVESLGISFLKNVNYLSTTKNYSTPYTPLYDGSPANKKYVDDKNKYSTSETVIGTWIDNKPIYRKVFSFEVDNVTTNYTTDINNMGTLVTIRGITLQPEIHPLPHAATSYNFQQTIAYIKEDKKIQVKSGSGVTLPYDVYAILEYTKTTD